MSPPSAQRERHVHLFIEGGGQDHTGRKRLRQGFSALLEPLKQKGLANRVRWDFVMCGATEEAYEQFCDARPRHAGLCVLLVDADGPLQGEPWDHLQKRSGKLQRPATDACCHLMVETMEAWLLCDLDEVARYYGKAFRRGILPRPEQAERTRKTQLEQDLKRATETTQKGEYHKIRHAADLLERISFDKVREHSRSFRRLVDTLTSYIEGRLP